MPEHKYILHSTKDCNGVLTKRSIKDRMGGTIGSRNHAAQQHKKPKNKQKTDLKALNKPEKLYIIAKKSGPCREIQRIKKIRKEVSKDTYYSSEDWDSNSLLSRNNIRDKERRPAGRKEINKLCHAVTKNIKDYNYQYNDAIDNELTLDNSSFNLSSDNRDTLPVVTVSLRGGKKHRETVVAGIT